MSDEPTTTEDGDSDSSEDSEDDDDQDEDDEGVGESSRQELIGESATGEGLTQQVRKLKSGERKLARLRKLTHNISQFESIPWSIIWIFLTRSTIRERMDHIELLSVNENA